MWKVKIVIKSDELSNNDLQLLLQAIRDCEQGFFKEKNIWIWFEAPGMTSKEMADILTSIKPPYDYGPVIIGRKLDEAA